VSCDFEAKFLEVSQEFDVALFGIWKNVFEDDFSVWVDGGKGADVSGGRSVALDGVSFGMFLEFLDDLLGESDVWL